MIIIRFCLSYCLRFEVKSGVKYSCLLTLIPSALVCLLDRNELPFVYIDFSFKTHTYA